MKLNVRTKLLSGFLVVIALMVVVGVFAISRMGGVNDTVKDVNTSVVPSLQAVGAINGDVFRYRGEQLSYIVDEPAERRDAARSFADAQSKIATQIGVLRRSVSGGERAMVARFDEAWGKYVSTTQGFTMAADSDDHAAALAVVRGGEGAVAFDDVTTQLLALNDRLQRRSFAQVADAEDTVSSGSTTIVVLLAIAAVIGIAIALLAARTIVGGVRQLVRAARGIAKGDVSQRVEIRSRDEIGEAGRAFGEMVDYLEETAGAAKAIAAGDLTVHVEPKSDEDVLGHAFAEMTAQLREALGDSSSLEALVERMETLSEQDLAALEHALAAVAAGDLTVAAVTTTEPLTAEEGAQLGRLAEIFNEMLQRLQSSVHGYDEMRARVAAMLKQIASETQAVAAASQQMATTSEETGRAIGEIASAVGEVAAGADRQVKTVGEAREVGEAVVQAAQMSSDNAEQTARAAEQARTVAEEGAETIARATEGMQALVEVSSTTTEAMRGLGAKSDQIGGIVATITGIAEQTNLLALNAAIEAARAGEQGRGFAVVAEEVRKLAEESRGAAASISGLVAEIQRDTGAAVEGVEAGGAQIEQGVATVQDAREAFLRIGTSVEDMNARVGEIAGAVAEIVERAGQMGENMAEVVSVAEQSSASTEQVSASTQQTSASSQEIAASAQELAKTAEELERLVGQFTLEASEADAVDPADLETALSTTD
ncbi:HAMP domain-containing methyl-accepting chemotaxis protein [Conexibacter woesei]|uniref:Methyl-accepting chemotaxis sensory transducer n=1 Tax=Conexibacter woesei (strain DSM 14684 / CCUG 47730 / CIP 108061 / JCM 11494 / NBRC 100937 / ID131577) TaxID=469383 RepID=D3EZ59_CONWI|nr:methyl-accepting chemotaxis protein [Conexibacter woesei]ADB51824.1 methyl-accepting chemotaxis sensory transducer [Conexibacter woesei DSM 14684]